MINLNSIDIKWINNVSKANRKAFFYWYKACSL